jgi:streptogramin lyase
MQPIRLASIVFAVAAVAVGILIAPMSATAKPNYAYAFSIGSYGSENGQFNDPDSIAVDSKDNLWVADRRNHRVEKFNSKGEFILSRSLGLGYPEDIAVDSSDGIWVAESTGYRTLLHVGSSGELSVVDTTGKGVLNDPVAVALDAAGNIWTVDWEWGALWSTVLLNINIWTSFQLGNMAAAMGNLPSQRGWYLTPKEISGSPIPVG